MRSATTTDELPIAQRVPEEPVRLSSTTCDRVLVLDRPVGVVGRAMGATYRVQDSTVSRVHAQLEYVGAALVVSDLESTSGTAVEGVRVESPVAVERGQEVRFGRLCFVVGPRDARPAPTPPEPAPRGSVHNPLTPRQSQVLVGMADGLTNAEIADRLGLAPRTVKAYAAEIFDRLGRRSRAGAVAVGHRLGLLDHEPA